MDWKRIWEVAEQALGFEPHERAAFVDVAFGDDPELRREVEALVAVFAASGRSTSAPGAVATEILPAKHPSDAPLPGRQIRVGSIVDGKYRIDGMLGAGGMGAVYRATHIQLERAVALKAIRNEWGANPVMAERFRREAVAVARLRHPNIVTVHDYGVAPDAGAYLVMELLEGRSLRQELARRPRLDVAMALDVVAQVCVAVGAANAAGVIHRDLKPENIFLEQRDEEVVVKVVDFGLARLEAEFQSLNGSLTHEGEVLGTPGYISPEQCRGEEADARSDVYAIGCVLFELLTGTRPFNGKTIWEVIYQHVNEPPPRPGELVPDLPPLVEEALVRALAKAPGDRHQTAEAFAEALGVRVPSGSHPTVPIGSVGREPAAKRPPDNLPHAVTRFVGREHEIDEVRAWLAKARLVTLVGPGGIGKTRLALETAAHALGDYEDGVWLVELAALAEPALVPHAVGAALGVRDHPDRPKIESVEAWLRDKSVLLVLDNCEHLVTACAELISRLLGACARLRVLATSRESLAVSGEAAWQVPALAVPAPGTEDALESEAARLFVDRASLAKPGFEATDAVAEVCRRLEGIPLAIELAAARVKALTVEQILERLDDRFRLLAGGSRTTPTRQQTLRAALDWSYDLLEPEEKTLFARLSVFAGGFTLESAECLVLGAEPEEPPRAQHLEALQVLSRLVDKSLVIAQGQTPEERFRMLEIVREYASDRLRESGAADEVARRHADVFRALATVAETKFVGSREAELLRRLEAEHDNLRAALGWLLEHAPDECLGLATALSDFWSLHGHFREGLRWMTAAVERSSPAPSSPRLRAIRSMGEYAWRTGDLPVARARLEESLRLARGLNDARQIAWSTFHLAVVMQHQGDLRTSTSYLEESLALGRELGDDRLVGNTLNSLGEAARITGDWAEALPFYEQSLAVHRQMGHPVGISLTLSNLGAALCDAGDLEAARSCYLEALPHLRELGNEMGLSLALDGLGALAARRGEWERAARLAGAAAALREGIGGELEPADRSMRERYLGEVREHLSEAALETALADGHATARDRMIDEAMEM